MGGAMTEPRDDAQLPGDGSPTPEPPAEEGPAADSHVAAVASIPPAPTIAAAPPRGQSEPLAEMPIAPPPEGAGEADAPAEALAALAHAPLQSLPSPSASVLGRLRPSAKDPGEQPAGDAREVLDRLRDIATARDQPLIVGLLGFSTSGKTWFLERLKWDLRGSHTINPSWFDRERAYGKRIVGTRGVSLHRFVARRGDGLDRLAGDGAFSFYVVDLEGELFRLAVEAHFASPEMADLLKIVSLCNAHLFVLPAAEYLFADELHDRGELIPGLPSEEALGAILERSGMPAEEREAWRREANEARYTDISVLHESVSELATLIAYVETVGGAETALQNGLTRDTLMDFEQRHGGKSPKPAALVLTMADTLARVIEASPTVDARLKEGGGVSFDEDPIPLVMHFRPEILYRMASSFRWWMVDFVTAWSGHAGGDEPDTRCDQYGMLETVEWFRQVRREAARPNWLAPMSTLTAIRLRSLLDGAFGRQWRRRVLRRRT
jgi:hypothetical protein